MPSRPAAHLFVAYGAGAILLFLYMKGRKLTGCSAVSEFFSKGDFRADCSVEGFFGADLLGRQKA